MVGGCGVIGTHEHHVDGMAASLSWTGDEHAFDFADGSLRLVGFTHDERNADQPARAASGDVLVWAWGNVVGYDGVDGYVDRGSDHDGSTADYCARRYDEHGLAFPSRLNGDFVGVLYERDRGAVSVFTDRLGTWKLFYTRSPDGPVVFSSHAQSLAEYPSVAVDFDDRYVAQHLALRGPYGVRTPLRDVETFPPGTVTTYDLDEATVSRDVYWKPTFDDVDRPYSRFVDEFVERFRASVRARTGDPSKRYGLLLSGGSDARLVLGAMEDDIDVTAFHMGDWMNKEARIAERVALTADVDFRFLRRDPGYFERLLDRSPAMWNFDQLFNKAWAEGFMDEIRSEVDVILTGHFCDTMFKGWQVPNRHLRLGPLGSIDLPVERSVSSLDDLVDEMSWPDPPYLDTDVDGAATLRRDVHRTEDGFAWFGLEFDTLRDLVMGKFHYPATTDSFFRQSLRENLVLQMPALDTRLMELWTTMPSRYQLRHNIVNDALEAVDPDLAAIPHATSGVPVRRSTLAHRLGSLPMNAVRRLSPFDTPPKEYLNHGPWGPHGDLIRNTTFVEEAIAEEEELIRSLPFLSWDGVRECHERHLEGENFTTELYRLLTLLKAPVTTQIAERYRGEDDPRAGTDEPTPG